MYETTYNDFLWNDLLVNPKMVENYLNFIQSDNYRFTGFTAEMNVPLYCKSDFCADSNVKIFLKVSKAQVDQFAQILSQKALQEETSKVQS